MNELLNWLLDLDALRLGEENVRLSFERPFPAWMWPGLIIGVALAGLWSYRRLDGARTMRIALGATRALLLIALLALIAGPRLVHRDESVERDWVIVLVDRSASMTVADVEADDRPGRVSRERQLRAALERSWPMWSELSANRVVMWMGFDAGAYELAVGGVEDESPFGVDLSAPVGQRTGLGASLEQALQRAAARPVAGVVVLSDGQSIDDVSRTALRRLQAERIPVFSVPVGSAAPVGDLAIRSADGPGVAFVDDIAPVRIEIERLGEGAPRSGAARLIDRATGMVLDRQDFAFEPDDETVGVTLTHKPEDAGRAQWVVEIVPDGPDLIEENNTAQVAVELVDRPMRVLYIDGVARWEQRYLKNLLLRERSVTSSNLILAPNRRYLQEGDVEISALPVSPEEWAEYDVVVLGDVRPEVFSESQLRDLREHIAIRGGGLIWIGGPSATPDAWWTTPLADLLPFTARTGAAPVHEEAVVMAPTPIAERLGVLRLGPSADEPWPSSLSDPTSGWSLLRWSQRIDRAALKPAAETLALGIPHSIAARSADSGAPAGATPLVLSMRFGAGRALYVATDEIWRWRYGLGELLPERFWLQLVRLLGRESLSRSHRSALLTISPRRPLVGQPVRIGLELLDQSLIELDLASVNVRLARVPDATDPEELTEIGEMELTLRRDAGQARRYGATWTPTVAGRWRAEAIDAALAGLGLTAEAVVTLADDEMRRPETDHMFLARLSDATRGRVIEPSRLDEIDSMLPNRRLRIINERAEPLWDSPLALIVVVLLLSLEWIGRRMIRLI